MVVLLAIAIAPKTQPQNDEKILQHPEIQKIIDQNPQLEMKLREIVERLLSDLDMEKHWVRK